MAKKGKFMRLTKLSLSQLDWLKKEYDMLDGEVIALALDRLAIHEKYGITEIKLPETSKGE